MTGQEGAAVQVNACTRNLGAQVADVEVMHRDVARLETLLAAVPDEVDTPAGLAAAEVWLAEAEALLARLGEGERAELLAAASALRARLPRPGSGLRLGVRPRSGTDAEAVRGISPEVAVHHDQAAAAQIYAELGRTGEAATTYIGAALSALRGDRISDALDLAVKGIVTFNGVPTVPVQSGAGGRQGAAVQPPQSALGAKGAVPELTSRRDSARHALTAAPADGSPRVAASLSVHGEGRMALALSRLCWEFFDHDRALRFAEIAAGELLGTDDQRRWAEAAQLHAEACLVRFRDTPRHDTETRTRLLTRARVDAEQLCMAAPTSLVREVTGPRLLAEVHCAAGNLPDAERPLDAALASVARLSGRRGLRRELAALRLARARWRHQCGQHEQALAELAAAPTVSNGSALADRLAVLQLRMEVREAAGDLAGALRDSRRIAELVGSRHERQISGFLDQVWGLAAHESRRVALEARQQDLIRTAEQDALTGLANRRGIESFCAALAPDDAVTVAVVDVDHFKGVNDRFGHQLGDEVLRVVAQTMNGCVRAVDRVGRWGGEEFVVVLPRTSLDWGVEASARLRSRIAALDWANIARGLSVTISVGVARGRAADFAAVLSDADRALYEAKAAGRDRVATYPPLAPH